jgi:hypothetical protein
MLITQISLSMYHFFPEILKPFYSLFLVMSLVSLTTFSIVLMLWASNDAFENEPKLQNEEAEKLNLPLQDGEDVTQASTSILSEIKIERNETTQQGNFTQIKSLFIGYDEHNFQYTLSLVLSNNEAKEEFTEIKQVGTRLLNPFIHWLLFSIAKKNGVLIAHVDIATTKFRMIEFLNKDSEIKINQEKIFINEGGFFGLTISDENITFDKLKEIKDKRPVKDVFRKYIKSFVPENQIPKFKNNLEGEDWLDKKFLEIYDSLFEENKL